jgi:CheY-like chemotaxis protein
MRQQYREIMDPPGGESQLAPAENTGHPLWQTPGVLVVDDEPVVRSVLRSALEGHGFRVWLAAGGPEALDLYRQHRDAIAVVLLDIRMPGLDGPQTLDALRHLNPEVLACFMSADMGGYQPEELRERGARFVFAKPFCLDELAQALWRLAREVSDQSRLGTANGAGAG